MKTQLARVVQSKQKTKKDLSYLKNRYIAIIYGGLSKEEGIREIHKKLYSETIKQKKNNRETSEALLANALKTTSYLNKKIESKTYVKKQIESNYGIKGENYASILGIFLIDLLKIHKIEKNMSHIIVKEADKKEGESKDKIIGGILTNNLDKSRLELSKNAEKVDTSKLDIFYLASQHKDSASDHKDYQGKIYIDANYKSLQLPYGVKNSIAYYVIRHDIKTVQWVTGKPVWFITRPNCRHYFKTLSVKEVLSTSKTAMLNKYDMKTAIGDREYLQTIKHATNREWYNDVRNAQLLLKSYKERLNMHEMMFHENPCVVLQTAINKDKFLISKWQSYINEKSGLQK